MMKTTGKDATEPLHAPIERRVINWTDPDQALIPREDIFEFSWTLCLKEDFLRERLADNGQRSGTQMPNEAMF